MNVAIIGTGYVGLPTGCGLADFGNKVVCIDKDLKKIEQLNSGKSTIYEDGLDDLLKKVIDSGMIHFTASMEEGIPNADLVILAVGTPMHPITGLADLGYIKAAAKELAPLLSGYTVVATKSTVPVGTGDIVESIIKETNPDADVDVISMPEFLREGYAVNDFYFPDRIVVGTNSEKARKVIEELYEPMKNYQPEDKRTKMLFVDRKSSEVIKYASNAFLAVKIHFINEMADFCEASGANVLDVAKGMGLDSRIGPKFLNPGPGYGGSCFPKDTNAIYHLAKSLDVDMTLIGDAINGNNERIKDMAGRILFNAPLRNPKIAILGLAFKNGTDDCRESPAMDIVKYLLDSGAELTVYDPKAMGTAKTLLAEGSVKYANDVWECVDGAECVAILTEWDEFRSIDLETLANLVEKKTIVDLRNLLSKKEAEAHGFKYLGIGV